MGTRRKGRESALQILYQLEVFANSRAQPIAEIGQARVNQAIEEFFVNFEAPEEVFDHASSLVRGAQANIVRIDEAISHHSTKWRLERMAMVDRNVLRVATYELLYTPDLAASIVIDEAIEIARRFGSERSALFVNGVLDSIAADIRKSSPTKK